VREIDLKFFLDGDGEPEPSKAPVPVNDVPLANKLERVASTALDKMEEVLAIPLPDPCDSSFGNLSRAQTAAANTVIGAQLRVGEAAMRVRHDDVMPRLLSIIETEQRKLTALEEKVSQVEQVPRARDGGS
jgi:hypothetical protein